MRISRHVVALQAFAFVAGCGHRDASAANAATGAATASTTSTIAATNPARFFGAALLAHYADSLSHTPKTGHSFVDDAGLKVIQGRRFESGGPEVHDAWIDVAYVQAGRATLITGGHLDGSHLDSPGEHRGGSIVGGTTQVVAVGDVYVVPAGTPHLMQLAKGDTIRYLTVKVPAAKK